MAISTHDLIAVRPHGVRSSRRVVRHAQTRRARTEPSVAAMRDDGTAAFALAMLGDLADADEPARRAGSEVMRSGSWLERIA